MATNDKNLYKVSWFVPIDGRAKVLKTFGNMTVAQDNKDSGNCDLIGRWSELGGKSGVAIIAATNHADVLSFMLNWAPVCDIDVTPVMDDMPYREVVKTKPFAAQ